MPPPIHPLAEDLSPPISTIEFQAFVASVRRRNGLIEPVTLYQGKVLDGLIRVDACVFLEITPTYVDLPEGEDPVQFLRDKNLKRRHLTVGQRALVAAQLARRRGGVQDHSVNSRIEDEALASGISAKSVSDARRLLACGDHGLRESLSRDHDPSQGCVSARPRNETQHVDQDQGPNTGIAHTAPARIGDQRSTRPQGVQQIPWPTDEGSG